MNRRLRTLNPPTCEQGVKAGDLEQALLVLPFMDALRLLDHLLAWLAAGLQVSRRSLIWIFLDCLLDFLGLSLALSLGLSLGPSWTKEQCLSAQAHFALLRMLPNPYFVAWISLFRSDEGICPRLAVGRAYRLSSIACVEPPSPCDTRSSACPGLLHPRPEVRNPELRGPLRRQRMRVIIDCPSTSISSISCECRAVPSPQAGPATLDQDT